MQTEADEEIDERTEAVKRTEGVPVKAAGKIDVKQDEENTNSETKTVVLAADERTEAG